jgi:hypothetical protein
MSIAILDRSRHDADTGFPPPGDPDDPGRRDECGFPGTTEAEATCREIPVATVTQHCPRGHEDLLRTCSGHAGEVAGWSGSFPADMLTCPMCEAEGSESRISVLVMWDDMRPIAVIREG